MLTCSDDCRVDEWDGFQARMCSEEEQPCLLWLFWQLSLGLGVRLTASAADVGYPMLHHSPPQVSCTGVKVRAPYSRTWKWANAHKCECTGGRCALE